MHRLVRRPAAASAASAWHGVRALPALASGGPAYAELSSCATHRSFATTPASPSPSPSPSPLTRIRNIGIAAHIDAGKTTATERMLLYAGVIPACGEVHDGDTITDFLPQERERGITIKAAAITLGWRGHDLNLIDTPGHVDFTVEVERSFRVLDGAVLLYDAVNGVEAQSETVWAQARRYEVAALAFANKMDREGASYELVLSSMEKRLGARVLPLHMPLGEAGAFAGAVDLVSMEAVAHEDREGRVGWRRSIAELAPAVLAGGSVIVAPSGQPGGRVSIPGRADGAGPLELVASEVVDAARAARERFLERLADADEAVADAYLLASDASGAELGLSTSLPGLAPADLRAALRRVVCTHGTRTVPLLCGSAYKYKGVDQLLDAVTAYLPSPLDRPPVAASKGASSKGWGKAGGGGESAAAGKRGAAAGAGKKGGPAAAASAAAPAPSSTVGTASPSTSSAVSVVADPSLPLSALAFKVQNHPTRGPLVFFRVYQGTLLKGAQLLNVSTGEKERPSKLLQMLADDQREVEAVAAGHIGAATGLKGVRTGDSLALATDPSPPLLPRLTLPQPVFTASLEVNGPSEQKLLEEALATLTREDPSLHLRTDPDTGQTLLSGMGELHLDIAADRLRREYNVPVRLGKMMVAYRETLAAPSEVAYTYDRTVGTKRMWARVGVRVELAADDGEGEGGEDNADGEALSSSPCVFVSGEEGEPLMCRVVDESGGGGNAAAAAAAGGASSGLKPMPPALADAVRESLAATFGRGPLLGYPLVGLRVSLNEEECEINADTNVAAIKAATARAMDLALGAGTGRGRAAAAAAAAAAAGGSDSAAGGGASSSSSSAQPLLLEPVMSVEIALPDGCVGEVLNDLTSQRRGKIREVVSAAAFAAEAAGSSGSGSGGGGRKGSGAVSSKAVIRADVPLKSMVGYSTALRSRTAGEGAFSMEFARYAHVGTVVQRAILADPYGAL
jgi:elongation factor G